MAALGSGTVTIRASAGTNYLSIDGGNPAPSPLNRKQLAAGRHTIRFFDGRSGEVLDTQIVELRDGEHLNVVEQP